MNEEGLWKLFEALYDTPDKHPEYTNLVASLEKFRADWAEGCESEDEKDAWIEGYLSMLSDALYEEFQIDTDIVDIAPYQDLMLNGREI